MFELFFPDERVSSTYDIDFEALFNEGYRGILFDIDNTLVEHGKDADERAKKLFLRLKEIGFECCLVSNNKKKRVAKFNEEIGVHMVFNAHKPAKKNYFYGMALMGTEPKETLFIGDQLFTDVWGAKRIGVRNILVSPINEKEEIQIVIKRKLEEIVLNEYEKKRQRKERRQQKRATKKEIRIKKATLKKEVRIQKASLKKEAKLQHIKGLVRGGKHVRGH